MTMGQLGRGKAWGRSVYRIDCPATCTGGLSGCPTELQGGPQTGTAFICTLALSLTSVRGGPGFGLGIRRAKLRF